MFFLPYRSKKSLGHLCPCTFKQVSEINSLYNNKKWGTLQSNFYTIIHFFVQIEGSKLFSNVEEIYTVNLAFWMADLSRVVENVSNLYFLSLLNLATKNWWKYDLKVYGSYKLTWVAGSIVMGIGTFLASNPQGKSSSQCSCHSTTKNQQLFPAYLASYTGYCDLQSM